MTAEHKYEMTISLQIVEHLGLNLYSNTSAVISEAVANAWDADAKTVEITLEKDCITIKDDGCGMDTDDINNKYLTVGYQKRHLVPITPMLNRKVMGRKGIGKLSLLSIAETITIYSSKNGQKNALQISTQKLREAVSQTQTYYPEEVDDSGIDFEGNGTKIVLTNLKKSRTTALAGKLKQRLARRFAVIGADKQFEVKVNGEPITISDRNYLTKAQYLWYYLRPADEDIPAQPADEYTCMPMVVADYIKRHIQLLDDKFLVLAADEIRRHLEDYAEHEPNPNLWHDLLGALETEQRERATRKARKIRLCPACGKPLEVMSIADNQHSPGGFDVIAHCRNCLSDYEWFCDKDGGVSDMKQYFFG